MTSPNQSCELAILETSDLHCNVVPHDYYNDVKIEHFGLAKTATLIKKFRKIYENNILVDNGDLLQGSALADLVTRVHPLKETEIHPIFKVMNSLNYDIATVGNHDFNYGLDFLLRVIQKANFPYICSNVYFFDKKAKNKRGQRILPAHFILEKKLTCNETIRIGFLGVTPPQIMTWDKHILLGKVVVQEIVDAVKEQVKELKKKNVDLIVVLAHSGILPLKYNLGTENAVCEISKIKGIDAILSGHAHSVFPGGKIFNELENMNVDNTIGKINDIPVVMPGAWGSHLGIIRFLLEKTKGKWKVKQSFSEIYNVKETTADSEVLSIIQEDNEKTLSHIRSNVGESNIHIHSWFSTLQHTLTSQIIQETGVEFAKRILEYSKWKNLPILCSFAPVNTGGHGSPYIHIQKGPLAIKDISNLYPYDNELKVVLINKNQIKEWLEFSAQAFQQIDIDSEKEISLLNPFYPSFNFDCISNIEYKIDVTEPLGNRIKDLTYNSKPILPRQQFALVTNNYRASGGGNFPNFDKIKTIVDSTEFFRDILIDKIKRIKVLDLELTKSWSLIPTPYCKAKVFFESTMDSIPFHPPFLSVLSTEPKTKRVKYLVDTTKF
ncbi:bifunctional 2',3'-cyclic-nucleotide 2'-phosphodiesterase/3'-nucleotidase [Fluviispira multicolorata]|uniref:Bifunctional 2',3'-cyclic-nucleotide 2'-phosphodiesterase/3'-nucleotidase n=1 Tax=Fluviispira multicolorata TaxID=2654512 RepID=A0A833JCQ1_9BACT|nr:bifunctional 2',3'-cyclic-nucleotide 2'-phosphodiesterase/3'-nucleotidase [Fluviispira multicolorata]KAB8029787.1 bifunctional 2',3'-cyclic-nucleotide 2'-phosphodiesterase/3'-nucleotidase [Fluviispira multicolorata]